MSEEKSIEQEMVIHPLNDGIDHINMYTKGKTELGRLLTNLAHTPFDLPEGHFESVEAYWYWLLCDKKVDELKSLHSFKAKEFGKKLKKEGFLVKSSSDSDFQDKIKYAIRQKLKQNPHILVKLLQTTLPLKHYYYYQGTKNKESFNVQEQTKYYWINDEIERIRNVCFKKMAEAGQISSEHPMESEVNNIKKPMFKK